MEKTKKIAESEAKKVMEQYYQESKRISDKYKNFHGIDNGADEQKKLIENTQKKIQEIKRKYGIYE